MSVGRADGNSLGLNAGCAANPAGNCYQFCENLLVGDSSRQHDCAAKLSHADAFNLLHLRIPLERQNDSFG